MEKYIPKSANGCPVKFMAVSAHKDDTELMAFDGIVRGLGGVGFDCGAGRSSVVANDVGDDNLGLGGVGFGFGAGRSSVGANDVLDKGLCDGEGGSLAVDEGFSVGGSFSSGGKFVADSRFSENGSLATCGSFAAVILTDGGACPRANGYEKLSEEDMAELRTAEQKRAAEIGRYSALYLFEKSSNAVKKLDKEIILGLKQIFEEMPRLDILYLHNPFDSHPTHVAAFRCAIEAVRMLKNDKKPQKIYGCEGWRDLDWLGENDKVALDVSGFDNLSAKLMDCFESQNAVKRYDIASLARRSANATYFASHEGDTANALMYAVDITELADEGVSILEFAERKIANFRNNVFENLR